MGKRLYLIDAGSLYQTAQAYYRGKVDYAILMDRLYSLSEEDFEAVLFHEEPTRGGSEVFQNLVRNLGYRLVVIPPMRVAGDVQVSRSIAVHLAAYIFPRVGAFSHFDFVSGEVDYSPLSKYLISVGKSVRFWLFADRIPAYPQGEVVFHTMVPLNETYIMAQTQDHTAPKKSGDASIVDVLERGSKQLGCVDVGVSESKSVEIEIPGFTSSKKIKERRDSTAKKGGSSLEDALDGKAPPTGCKDV